MSSLTMRYILFTPGTARCNTASFYLLSHTNKIGHNTQQLEEIISASFRYAKFWMNYNFSAKSEGVHLLVLQKMHCPAVIF